MLHQPKFRRGFSLLESSIAILLMAASCNLVVSMTAATNRQMRITRAAQTGKNIIQDLYHLPREALATETPLSFDERGLPTATNPAFHLTIEHEEVQEHHLYHFQLIFNEPRLPNRTFTAVRRFPRIQP
ncbi:type IV pilus modification PilV family protein [Acanthopleuribacter pedis]|uniref:Uncharacterized protein n=1 Tax=Acanthopleuribacter pedis TaxID=442870 RepID=A0A8J7U6Q0_9BACT|nr:hypothetical protein [Acanthopleuribacter pedis]MBO1320616.1 hypothetical protein [Acanthopleuribacter pedis]